MDTEQYCMGLKKIDLRGLEPGRSGWEEARAKLMADMEAYGCVVVMPDGLSTELRQALFGRAMPELFALPREVKLRNAPCPPTNTGYLNIGALESMRVNDPTEADAVRDFAGLFWPQSNLHFCDAVQTFAKHMQKLERTVETMILESLGVEKYITSHLEMFNHVVRLLHYDVPPDPETGVSFAPHCDYGMSTVLVQHVVEGLEVQAKDGRWLPVPPDPDTCAFMAGELFTVLTNGRMPPCMHRVRTPSNRERLVALLGCIPRAGGVVGALDELVDEEHPLRYSPCDFEAYARFKNSDEGSKLENPLKEFCGVKEQ